MPESEILHGTGWRPDPPDPRDHTPDHPEVRKLLAQTGVFAAGRRRPPARVDLRRWASPVQYQGHYNTCTAHVVAGMLELLENRAHGSWVPASRLFLYRVAKRMLGETGDPGTYLRQVMGAVVMLGVPPEKYWPYLDTEVEDDPRIDADPDAFCYAVADDYGAATYFRLDEQGVGAEEVLARIHACLASSMPCSIGFPLYMPSLERAVESGEMGFPQPGEKPAGSHAVLLVGYDQDREIPVAGEKEGADGSTKGAFLFKNSWGTDWGEQGYGWLPYRYLTEGLTSDCWIIQKPHWVETDCFQLGLEESAAPAGQAG